MHVAEQKPVENWRPALDALRADWEQFSQSYRDKGQAVTAWRVRIMNLQAHAVNDWMGKILDVKLPLTAQEIDESEEKIRLVARLVVTRYDRDGLGLPFAISGTFLSWPDLRRWLSANAVDDLDVAD